MRFGGILHCPDTGGFFFWSPWTQPDLYEFDTWCTYILVAEKNSFLPSEELKIEMNVKEYNCMILLSL